jgi:YggT family protein
MSGSYLTNPLAFLVNTIFGLYILCFVLRFMLQLVRADFYNPLSQFLVKITNPLLIPLRRVIPGWGGIDIASIVVIVLLQLIAQALVLLIRGVPMLPSTVIILSLAELVALVLNIYLVTIIVQVILSWIQPGSYNPVSSLLYSLNEPVLKPARRLIPPISGIDLSPLVVLLIIQLVKMLIIPPIFQLLR